MNQSQDINHLAEALSKAQAEFKVAHRSKKNPFFKSNYADLEAVVDACRPALAKYGLSFIQLTKVEGGSMVLVTRIMHSSGQFVEGEYPVKSQKDDPQGYGAAVTYSRRYALAAALGVVASDEDDDGERAVDHPKEDPQAQIEKVVKHFASLGVSGPKLAERYARASHLDLSASDIEDLREIAAQIKDGIPVTEFFDVKKGGKK